MYIWESDYIWMTYSGKPMTERWLCNALMNEIWEETDDWQVLGNSNHTSGESGRSTKKWELMKRRGNLRLTYGGLWKGPKVTLGWQMEGRAHKMEVVDLSPSWRKTCEQYFCTLLVFVLFLKRNIFWLVLNLFFFAGGEEDEQQREQGAGHRLQRLQAHFLRLPVPG